MRRLRRLPPQSCPSTSLKPWQQTFQEPRRQGPPNQQEPGLVLALFGLEASRLGLRPEGPESWRQEGDRDGFSRESEGAVAWTRRFQPQD